MSEVVVTGPAAPPISTVDDLAGQEVFVRKESIYEESLIQQNEQLKGRGKPPAVFVEAPAVLEDHLDGVKYAKNAAADAARKKLQAVVELFKKYGSEYNVDYLLMAAQGYQESNKYYITYRLLTEQQQRRDAAKAEVTKRK